MTTQRSRPVVALPAGLAGLGAALAMQAPFGWWMNSGRGVAYTGAVYLLLAAVCAWLGPSGRSTRIAALWVGAQAGFTGYLFWIGPGSIWPIVILMSGVVSGVAVLVGWGAGLLCVRRLARRS